MIRHLQSALTDMTYVFDEPTIGLHAHDVERMNSLLQRLRDKGNTVLVVEHDPEVIRVADNVVDMGPGAGAHGGTIVYQGSVDGLIAAGTADRPLPRCAAGAEAGAAGGARLDPDKQRAAPQPARTSRSTCRSASSSRSPASPAPARAR